MKALAEHAYNAYMQIKNSETRSWIHFAALPEDEQRCWQNVAQEVSDATRGWIQGRISGPMYPHE